MEFEPASNYVDLQVNGYVGVDFNHPRTTPDELLQAAQAMRADGVQLALPTVITGHIESMVACITNLVRLIHDHPAAAEIFAGIHVEGPFLSPVPGYIGAHPVEHAKPQDLDLLAQLLDAGGGLVRLVTLAPEIDQQGAMTRYCVERGIHVAAGHTDATSDQLECCVDAGLSLFTHLGNGCPRLMDRHDNIIMRALRLSDRLHYSLIADGFHIPKILFENILNWIELDRLLVVSDAISAAGLGPGVYKLGDREVKIGPDKAARDASGEHFVGAASTMGDADRWLATGLGLPLHVRHILLVENPRRWLKNRQPRSPI
jgi:N-acetylglucosamine-6-phosphate deacetylase